MSDSSNPTPGKQRVPLFPLPNVVLFPGAILPLHIFEPRYRRMIDDALASDRLIAMAMLRPGWEPDYYGRASIEPVVCVGSIVAHEKLEDGKYNLLLQGQWRATVVDETRGGGDTPYRLARLRRMEETATMEIDLSNERARLIRVLEEVPPASGGLGRQFAKLLAGPMPTCEIADLIAFNLLQDMQLKQSLLAEADVRRRVGRILGALDGMRGRLGRRPDQDASLN